MRRLFIAIAVVATFLLGSAAYDLFAPPSFDGPGYPVPLDDPDPRRAVPWAVSYRLRYDLIPEMLREYAARRFPGIAYAAGISGVGIFGNPQSAQVIDVAKSGTQFSRICDADCPTNNAQCAPDTAIAAITSSSQATPYAVRIHPGLYQECVAIDNKTDIALLADDWTNVIIRPSVADPNDVNGGTLRIANATNTVGSTARIEVDGGTWWNDAYASPEPAIFLQGPTGLTGSRWQDIYIRRVRAIGHHDALQAIASKLTTDDNPPRLFVDNVLAISSADAFAVKGYAALTANGIRTISQTDWCDTLPTKWKAEQTGTVVADDGGGTGFQIAAADDPGTDDAYLGRKVVTTDNGGAGSCGAAGDADGEWWVNNYDTATDMLTFIAGPADTFDTGCDYQIVAVKHNDGSDYLNTAGTCAAGVCTTGEVGTACSVNADCDGDVSDAPCLDSDWRGIRGQHATPFWKITGTHFGSSTSASDAPDGAISRITDLRSVIYLNDFGPTGSCASPNQGWIAGLLTYGSNWESAQIDDLSVEVNINADLYDGASCADPIAGIAYGGGARWDGPFTVTNANVVVNNRGDADENIRGVIANSTVNDGASPADTLRLAGTVFVDINNTVGSYAGTSTTLLHGSNAELHVLGNVTSPDLVTTEGTIVGWTERCFRFQDKIGTATDDNNVIPISDANVGIKIAYAGCRCVGTCGAAESIDVTDGAGTGAVGTATCVDNTADITWTDVRSGVSIPAADSPQWDTNVHSTTATDEVDICLRYTTSRFAP